MNLAQNAFINSLLLICKALVDYILMIELNSFMKYTLTEVTIKTKQNLKRS